MKEIFRSSIEFSNVFKSMAFLSSVIVLFCFKISNTRSAAATPFLTLYEALLMAFAGVSIPYAKAMNPIKVVPSMVCSIKTNLPPYHSKMAMVIIPKNSLKGPAKLFFKPILFKSKRILSAVFSKRFLKLFSALKLLIIFNPESVSSTVEINRPDSCWAFKDWRFKRFPMLEIKNPEMGMNNNTKMDNCQLSVNITINENKIANGSLTINSRTIKKEFFISLISPRIRAIISPFFCLA